MNFFFNPYIYYFRSAYSYCGNKLLILTFFSLITALLDCLGITLFIPILELSNVSSQQTSSNLSKFLLSLGYELNLEFLILLLILIFFIKSIILLLSGILSSYLGTGLLAKWKIKLLSEYKNLDYQYYTSKNSGHFTNVITLQANKAMGFISSFITFNSRIITAIVYFSIAFIMNIKFSIVALSMGLIVLVSLIPLVQKTRKLSDLSTNESGIMNKFLIQLLQSFKYLKATGRFNYLEKKAVESTERMRKFTFRSSIYSAFSKSVQEPIAVIFMSSIIFYQVIYQETPLNTILASLFLFYRALNSILYSQEFWQSLMKSSGGLKLMIKEFEEVVKHKEPKPSKEVISFEKSISIRDLYFSYGNKEVIKGVSFEINKNKTIAIVGESGSGKSTITDLIALLLEPKNDSLFIDGVSSSFIEKESWRKKIGFVMQDSVIFNDSVLNNISLWQDVFPKDKKRILECSKMAYCHDFIMELKDKYSTIIGERGINLSGGQKQRIAIARELYKNPEILILDEATSSLDSESEMYIQKSIDKLKGSLTVIIIAHRLATIKNADEIILLQNGKVSEKGTFGELKKINKHFKRMTNLQKL